MKVITGKFSGGQFHGITNQDVIKLFKHIPKEWSAQVQSVVLSAKVLKKNQLPQTVVFDAASKKLTVHSRGYERDDIVKQMLLILAAKFGEGIDAESEIKPYMQKFLKSRF
jgi:hypothetical protein